jgi:hypothetical protein
MGTNSLTAQVAVVTGASSGIGLAVARELRTLGLRLVLTARSEDRLSQICSELGAATLVADITDATVPQRLLATALASFGRCDVVVNNAGAIEVGPIESIDIDNVCSMGPRECRGCIPRCLHFYQTLRKTRPRACHQCIERDGYQGAPDSGSLRRNEVRDRGALRGTSHGGRWDEGIRYLHRAGSSNDRTS